MKPGTIAFSIKRLTAPDHRLAEQAVEACEPFASRARYAAYMCTLHAFYAAFEPPLFAWLAGVPALETRHKLPRIARDLALLGARPVLGAPRVPRIASKAEAFGIGYVLEGKTLGSRFLLEEARTKLGLDAGTGASFLAGYGSETGAMWRGYLEALGGFVAAHGRRATIVRAARATFASFTAFIAPI